MILISQFILIARRRSVTSCKICSFWTLLWYQYLPAILSMWLFRNATSRILSFMMKFKRSIMRLKKWKLWKRQKCNTQKQRIVESCWDSLLLESTSEMQKQPLNPSKSWTREAVTQWVNITVNLEVMVQVSATSRQ